MAVLGAKNKNVVFVAMLIAALFTFFGFAFCSDSFNVEADTNISTEREIVVTKNWVGDFLELRPDDITVHLIKTTSTLKTGTNFKNDIVSIAGSANNIQAILQGTRAGYEANIASSVEVQSSGDKTYAYYNGGNIYIYSEADNIYMNADSSGMFSSLTNLSDISGLSGFNSTYVTNMQNMFYSSRSISSVAALANWDVLNVTNMSGMFDSGVTGNGGPFNNSLTSIAGLAGWNTQKVTNMSRMFSGCRGISDPSPISNWNVKNVTTMVQMFFQAGLTNATSLAAWEPIRVTTNGFNNIFQNLNGKNPANNILPYYNGSPGFTNRVGNKWDKGNLKGVSNPVSGSEPTVTKTSTISNDITTIASDWVKNVDNTWTYSFTVSDDGSIWKVYEEQITEPLYIGSNYVTNPVMVTNNQATITNTLEKYDITVKKKITGNMADINARFGFTMSIYKPDKPGESGAQVSDYYIPPDLGENESFTFIIPKNYQYIITEDAEDSFLYNVFYKIENTTNGTIVQAQTQGSGTTKVTPASNQTVTFTNNYEKIPITGIYSKKQPFSIMIAIVVGASVALIGLRRIDRLRQEIKDG